MKTINKLALYGLITLVTSPLFCMYGDLKKQPKKMLVKNQASSDMYFGAIVVPVAEKPLSPKQENNLFFGPLEQSSTLKRSTPCNFAAQQEQEKSTSSLPFPYVYVPVISRSQETSPQPTSRPATPFKIIIEKKDRFATESPLALAAQGKESPFTPTPLTQSPIQEDDKTDRTGEEDDTMFPIE